MKKLMIALLAVIALAGCQWLNPPPPPAATYTVTYNANGGTGSAPVDTATYTSGASATANAATNLSRAEFKFAGWNTAANGSGTGYAAAGTITIGTANLTLYAQWTDLIIGTWSANIDLQYTHVNMKDVTTITATTFSTARTLTWTAAAPTVLAALGANAATQTALGIAPNTTVMGSQLDALNLSAQKNLLGFTGVTGPCSQVINSGSYTRLLGGASFALPQNSAAITAAAASMTAGQVIGSAAITYTGYFTRQLTFSTMGDTAGTPAAAVSATNPKQQNWVSYFSTDTNTVTFYDGGSVMPATRVP
jgi:uncharacterized repeat protein (TIGR02543 family)